MIHVRHTVSIGFRRREKSPDREYTSMLSMPVPVAWGGTTRPASRKGHFRLEKGEICFEVIHARIFPERPIYRKPVEDRVIGRLDKDTRRPVLPPEEESPGLNPRIRPRPDADPSGIDDYTNPGDSDVIYGELLEQIRSLSFRVLAGVIVTLFLGLLELLPMLGVTLPDMFLPDKAPIMYLALNLGLCGFCAMLCYRVIIGGFVSLIKRPDSDSALAVATTAALLHMAAELIVCLSVRQPVGRVFGAPVTLALLLNDAGLLLMARRVARNFRFVAVRGVKSAARMLGEDTHLEKLRHADHHLHSHVTYCVKAKFLSGYLRHAYEEDFCEQMFRRLTPYIIFPALLAAVVGGITGASESGIWSAIYCFVAVLVVGIPASRMFCLNLPLSRVTGRLLRRGALVNGWACVDEFGRTDTLAVSSDVLFPEGSVRLLSLKAFGEESLSRSVQYAASVVLAAGGPLAQVFEQLLEGDRSRALPAEGIDYENEMGVSGFVESLPVLVGNRMMLKTHGCAMPSRDYEHLLTGGDNRSLVYIAISGVPCAVLLVKYSADADTVNSVQRMVESGVSLVVYTCDANVTAKMLSRIYNVPQRYITMLSTRAGSEYDRLTHVIRDSSPAVLASDGSMRALADALTVSRRLHVQLHFSTVIQLVAYGLMLMLTTLLCCLSGSTGISPAQIMLLQLLCLAAAALTTLKKAL
ncbi:MAG: hypothetical protein E7554_04180 [Ruminococcaceae bacterium]|nr:hypothetical protein [Oscillospiraceae bacterium]